MLILRNVGVFLLSAPLKHNIHILIRQIILFLTVFVSLFVSLLGMTVLNKSKWKGGTIQIEQARETFLQK